MEQLSVSVLATLWFVGMGLLTSVRVKSTSILFDVLLYLSSINIDTVALTTWSYQLWLAFHFSVSCCHMTLDASGQSISIGEPHHILIP